MGVGLRSKGLHMAAGDTALSICSDALLMLGAKGISSFTEGTDESSVSDRLYPNIRDQALMMYPWSFAIQKTQLAQLVTTPVSEYAYEYQLPSDRLGSPRAVYDTAAQNVRPRTDYRIMGGKLLTNSEIVYIDYQYSVPETEMPIWFVQLLKYLMSWHLAIPITDQVDKAGYWQTIAVGTPGDNGRGGFMRSCMNMDGMNQPNNSINDFSLIAVRY
jgi:hypothetical protein